ncbi:MAG TPA: PAS domain S-box protein [Verrucomicrobiae bacterium]|nr:PAS domain S-box protein [Verrucomicrobiae bacterium]
MFQEPAGNGFERAPLPLWQLAGLLCLAFFLCAWLGDFLSPAGGTVVSYWLPGGFFVAVLLVNPTRDWPWLMLAILPANIGFDVLHDPHPDFQIIAGFCLANILQAGIGAWLVRRFITETPRLASLKEFFGLMILAGGAGSAVGATIGATMLTRFHLAGSFVESWKILWGGNVMAVLVLTPVVLAFDDARTRRASRWNVLRLAEVVLVFGGMAGFLWFVLTEGRGIGSPKIPVLIFVLWAGLRFGLRGASVMVFLLAMIASYLTTHFVKGLSADEVASGSYIFTLQVFVAVAAMVGLVPTIVLAERDRALMRLRDSENRYRSLTEAAFEGVVISVNGRIMDASDQAMKMFGYGRDEFIGKEIVSLVVPAEREQVAEAIRTQRETIYGHGLQRKDGSIFYAEAQSRHVELDGQFVRMTALRDITEKKKAEQALRESEEKFSKAFYSSPDAISITEAATGRFLDVNDGFAPLYGYAREELIGRTSLELNMWRDPAERDKLVQMLKQDGKIRSFPSVGRMRSGELFQCLASADLVEIKGRLCIISLVRDISEQKRAEAALRESEEKFSKAFRTSPDVMSIADLETGHYLDVNEAHQKVFGFTREEVIGHSPLELGILLSPEPREKMLAQLRATGSVRDLEVQARNRKGEMITILHSAEMIELNGRKCILRVSHDITDRIRAENLGRSQRQVMEMIASGCPLQETLEALLQMVEMQSPEMLCSILMLEADGTHFRNWAARSLPVEFMHVLEGLAIGPCAGSCGTAAFRKEPVFVADIATDPLWADYKHLALPHGLRACWSTPIMDAQRRVVGTFAIYYRQPGLPDERHQQLIAMATHTAAICISKQNTEAERAQSIAREQKARIEYTFQLIASQEAERKRIAAELHDSLGQNLLLIKNLTQMALRDQDPAATYERVAGIDHLAAQCIAETRQISRDLHPHQLDHLGLKRALESMLESVSSASVIHFEWKIDGVDELFSSEGAMNVYRIVQESLNNVLKHSHAKTARINLERDIHEVQLRITDDGCGFVPGHLANNKKGLGLKNIPERVRMLGGTLKVDSAPGGGTWIEVLIPVAAGPE